jgi:hypothetical protein
MNQVEALHTTVRRYCITQWKEWSEAYSQVVSAGRSRIGRGYTDEALNIFPRYNVLSAILVDVERLSPDEFASIAEAREIMKVAAETADDDFTREPIERIASEAIADERRRLVAFIEGISAADLENVEPLFFRRVLSPDESQRLWEGLRARWGIAGKYWFPLSVERPDGIEAFQDKYFESEFGESGLRALLSERGIQRVYELQEWQTEYELELSVVEPSYSGSEGYWCDDSFEWIIYASHEGSITVGGWFLNELKDRWPSWSDRVWTTPFFD